MWKYPEEKLPSAPIEPVLVQNNYFIYLIGQSK